MKKTALTLTLAVLFSAIAVGSQVVNLAVAQTSATIIIKADGSINPPTAPIAPVGEIFKVTANLHNTSLIVERNNIFLDGQGFTIQGRGFKADGSVAIKLACTNVTVANFQISGWQVGIYGVFDNNTIINNNFTDNHHDIAVYANNYRILGNNLGPERIAGNNNIISQNQITLSNYTTGFWITNSSGTKIESNNITLAKLTTFFISTDNGEFQVFHNNFLNIEEHTGGLLLYIINYPTPANATSPYWDNGAEGNYWSDYARKYPAAREVSNSGIGNMQYVSSTTPKVIDRYPLIAQYNFTTPTSSNPPTPTAEPLPTDLGIILAVLVIIGTIALVVVILAKLLVYYRKDKLNV